jgi:hypothetical protein
MWKTKKFRAFADMIRWIEANKHRIQWQQVFINNVAAALEYKPLVEPRLPR